MNADIPTSGVWKGSFHRDIPQHTVTPLPPPPPFPVNYWQCMSSEIVTCDQAFVLVRRKKRRERERNVSFSLSLYFFFTRLRRPDRRSHLSGALTRETRLIAKSYARNYVSMIACIWFRNQPRSQCHPRIKAPDKWGLERADGTGNEVAKSMWALGTRILTTISCLLQTTGREDGPLKEDWGRELWKLTDCQPQSKNDFDFGTKLRFINPFPHVSLKPTCVSITWTLIFELFQKPGDLTKTERPGGCTKNRETPGKNGRVGMSVNVNIL